MYWSAPTPATGYLCLALALFVHSSLQTSVTDQGYTHTALDHSDIGDIGYDGARRSSEGTRLKRLLKISKHLDQKSRDIENDVTQIDEGTASLVKDLARNVRMLLDALESQSRTDKRSENADIITEVRTHFISFHDSLTNLCAQLPDKLKPDAPAGLKDVGVLTSIITPADHSFSDDNPVRFSEKYLIVQDLFFAMFDRLDPHLTPSDDNTNWWINYYVTFNMVTSQVNDARRAWLSKNNKTVENSSFAVSDAGVGGALTAAREDMSAIDLQKLTNFVGAVNCLIINNC